MSGLEIVIPVVLPICLFIVTRILYERRKEICRFEKLLDENEIHYKPSTMYRAPKDWKKKLKQMSKCKRTKCKVDELSMVMVGEQII